MGRYDAVVEIWNGVPVVLAGVAPNAGDHLPAPRPRADVGPDPARTAGLRSDGRSRPGIAPPFYRRGLTVDAVRRHPRRTPRTRLPRRSRARRSPTAPTRCSPGGHKTANPSIVAVGRLAPVKRFELLIDSAVTARRAVPDLTLTIVGEGPRRRRTARSGGPTRRRRLDPLRRAGRPRRPRRRCTGRAWIVASGVAGGGLGPEPHRGRGLWDTGGGHRHPRPSQQCRRRRHRRAGRARPTRRTNWPVCCSTMRLRLRLGQAALERARTLTWDASALGIIRVLHRAVTVTVGNDSRQ